MKSAGFAPATIYDIGAYHGRWSDEASVVFPDANFIMFEANAGHAATLNATGRSWFNVAIGASDTQREFFVPNLPSPSGASLYPELAGVARNYELSTHSVQSLRLDTVVSRDKLPLPDLIKLDIQGAEIDALSGASACLQHCQVIIAETALVASYEGAPLMADLIAWLRERGFFCTDIAEVHRRGERGDLIEVDLVFVTQDGKRAWAGT
jgi:FkbM family methyltransferase